MFLDRVLLEIEAGRGGDGAVSFLHETCMPRGGPDGGDGGDGGSVILRASTARMTLQDVGSRRIYKATPGVNGKGKKMAGRDGKDTVIIIPVGTLVIDDTTGETIADLTEPGDLVICKGGRGGKGNARFATAINQAPRIATRGGDGQKKKVRLELKLLAEVGIVGLPNAGKSTLLSAVSRATPKIAAYPFTTLHPHLGVATTLGMGRELILADIPGLIEGASEGKGLGDDFLRHVERTRLLVHLVDGTSGDPGVGGPTPEAAYRTVRKELEAYRGANLTTKPEIVALNKIDALDPAEAEARANALAAAIGKPVLRISGVSGDGTRALLEHLEVELKKLAAQDAEAQAQAALDSLGATTTPPST